MQVKSKDSTSSDTVSSSPSEPFPDLHPPEPLPIIFRASDGKSKEKRSDRIKISTIVQADELEAFFTRYLEVWKMGMGGLKKRDRSGNKAKAKAKKKSKGATGDVKEEKV